MKFKTIFGVIILTAACGVMTASAQASKRKPKPMVTPLPTLSGAEIISRAGEFEEPTNSAIVPKPQRSPSTTSTRIRDLNDRVDKLEAGGANRKEDAEAKQRRMLLNLDILTRAEQRSEGLRKQLFELAEKENSIQMRISQIDIDSRPESIEREIQMGGGSLRPEEVRDARRKRLDAERASLENLLTQLQTSKAALTISLEKADVLVDKLRAKLDKDIDENFFKDDQPEID